MRRLIRYSPLLLWVVVPLTVGGAMARKPAGEVAMGRYTTALQGRTPNQRYNAHLALEALDGAIVEPGKTFSFNERVGTWSRDAGYRKAPVSFNGQLIMAWGGGVCQTSTTLYNAALLSGMEVVERHQHRHAPGYVPPGRDAAVAFHGIDLKFRNPNSFSVRITARMDHGRLEVAILGERKPYPQPQIVSEVHGVDLPRTLSANPGAPIGHIRNTGHPGFEVTTYLVTGNRKRVLSKDSYPVTQRVVEYGEAD